MYVDGDDTPVEPERGKRRAALTEYRKNLEMIVERLQATGAELIFAVTTSVPEGAKYRELADPPRYNAVALEVMASRGIEVNDLHAAVAGSSEPLQLSADVHFSEAGYRRLGALTAAVIAARLEGGGR
jgi:acyl-CoA thioesterase-1